MNNIYMKTKTKIKRFFKKPNTIILLSAMIISSSLIMYEHISLAKEITTSVEVTVPPQDNIEKYCSLEFVQCDTEELEMKEWVWIRLNQNLGYDDATRAMKIIECESGWNPMALHVNNNKTVDIGLVQINFPTHQDKISPQQALDWQMATDFMIKKRLADGNFNAWVCNRYID